MSIYYNEKKNNDICFSGDKIATEYYVGDKVYEGFTEPPGLYIAEGRNVSGGFVIDIFENNDGIKGNLVDTILKDDWQTLSEYAPEIEIALDRVINGWTGVGVPLNFAKLKTIGNYFSSATFNSEVLFPKLEKVGESFLSMSNDFNKPISLPNLKVVGQSFMAGCMNFNQKIIFPSLITTSLSFMMLNTNLGELSPISTSNVIFSKLIMNSTNMSSRFLGFNASNFYSNKYIRVRFETLQTTSSFWGTSTNNANYIPFIGRNTNSNIHNYVDLEIKNGSANVNVANRTWAGHTFRSITLI